MRALLPVLVLAMTIYALLDCARTPEELMPARMPKVVWIVLIASPRRGPGRRRRRSGGWRRGAGRGREAAGLRRRRLAPLSAAQRSAGGMRRGQAEVSTS